MFVIQFRKYTKRRVLSDEIKELEAKSSIEMLAHIDEYRYRKKVDIILSDLMMLP